MKAARRAVRPMRGVNSSRAAAGVRERAREQSAAAALASVEQQCRERNVFASRAQHVGRADIARADTADVAHARGRV